jgi:hypothetical protein
MPTWLVEDPTYVYMLLGIVAVALAAAYWTRRQGKYAIGVGVVLLLIGLVALLDYLIVTDREQIVRNVGSLCQAVGDRDLDRAFAHLSKDFRYHSLNKATFEENVRRLVSIHQPNEAKAWDFEVLDVSREKRSATVLFRAKVKGNWSGGAEFYLVRAEYVLDPDGQWRMKTFKLSNPLVNTEDEVGVPGL